jgi:DNA ligase D-like protein (predicted ligase)/DNA ligase D-like protein (predicted 3'-phosphoesterase)
LAEDAKKWTFANTPEPVPYSLGKDEHGFVVHRHDASRMHYDLRLEQNGALRSWAIPKGLPPHPGVKRLAVSTEDHPIEYLNFEGAIPKGQYGGGNMWIYAQGKYEITKEKKNGFYFRLESPQLTGEYRIHLMKEKEWLLERVDLPQVNWLQENADPMLAESMSEPPLGDQYIYEVKWDGIRALIHINEGELRIMTRNKKDITTQFPELNIPESAFKTSSAVLDGEIVVLDPQGRPHFKDVIGRMQKSGETNIELASRKKPAFCYLFDCLYLDGRSITHETLERRRAWLKSMVRRDTSYRVSETVEDGEALFNAATEMGLEGIMAKDRNSNYSAGRRSSSWVKVKVRHTTDVVIIGYTNGKGDRKPYFGALQIAELNEEGTLIYRGKVGSGFDTRTMKSIMKTLESLPEGPRPVQEKPPDNAETTWLKPELVCEIQYASVTPNETFREPVFKKLKPDEKVKNRK